MFFDDRPKIKLQKSNFFKFLEILPFILLGLGLLYNIIMYLKLPENIPIHFNFYGEINDYADKDSIWALNVLGFILVFIMYKLMQHPENFNYTVKITEQNAEKQYYSAIKTMNIINIILAMLFLVINYEIVNNAIHNGNGFSKFSNYLLNGLLILMVLIPIVQVIKSFKKS